MRLQEVKNEVTRFFVRNLLEWHKTHRRIFPWRTERTPFRVLIAELMLQRTRTDQVAEVFGEFIKRFPDPESIANAEISTVCNILEHLGLRHRIPRIVELSRVILTKYEGEVPNRYEALASLPGVGPYIASAVLCFGFGQDVPIVDANIVRVLSRFFNVSSAKKRRHTDPLYWDFAHKLIPENEGIQFNEALLDFAALVCRKKPLHGECPVASVCTCLEGSSCDSTH